MEFDANVPLSFGLHHTSQHLSLRSWSKSTGTSEQAQLPFQLSSNKNLFKLREKQRRPQSKTSRASRPCSLTTRRFNTIEFLLHYYGTPSSIRAQIQVDIQYLIEQFSWIEIHPLKIRCECVYAYDTRDTLDSFCNLKPDKKMNTSDGLLPSWRRLLHWLCRSWNQQFDRVFVLTTHCVL